MLPDKPVYWLIWILDQDTKKPCHSRGLSAKHKTPEEAAKYYYGLPVIENMIFWNLSSNGLVARRMMRQVRQEWIKAGGQ
jgi:hypothetical protein